MSFASAGKATAVGCTVLSTMTLEKSVGFAVPVRVATDQFKPNRTQRRIWKQHGALVASVAPLHYDEEHYALYMRYQSARHAGGGMDRDSRDQYEQFLLQSRINSRLVEFREPVHAVNAVSPDNPDNPDDSDASLSGSLVDDPPEPGTLRMISMIDILGDGLSSVYTFFEPGLPHTSFGTYNILWQIEQARQLDIPYVYLGYWIKESAKMAYKTNFRPLEALQNGNWTELLD